METLFDYYKDHFKCRIHNQKLKQVSAQGHDHTTNNSNHLHTTTVEAMQKSNFYGGRRVHKIKKGVLL